MKSKPIEQWTIEDYKHELAALHSQRDDALQVLRDIVSSNSDLIDALSTAKRYVDLV